MAARGCRATPSTLIVEGLRRWQGRAPDQNCEWRIAFAGQEFDAGLIAELENATCLGKMSLADYADFLNRTAIGLSLMIGPHPRLSAAGDGFGRCGDNHEQL